MQPFLRPPEAARYLSTSISTLAKLRLNGGGPKFYKIGRAVRYSTKDLHEYMAQHKATSTSDFPGVEDA